MPSAMIALAPVLIDRDSYDYECIIGNDSIQLTKETFCQLIPKCNGTVVHVTSNDSTSIVKEWGLHCERSWILGFVTSVQMVGSMVGALVFPQLADRYGRRKIFFTISFLMGISACAGSQSGNVYIYAVLRWISGLTIGGLYVVYLNYLMEFLTPRFRTICGCLTLWAAGEMCLALLGYLLPNWRDLTLSLGIGPFLVVFAFPWLPESPRWLLCKNRTKEAYDVFNEIASWNGRSEITMEEVERVQKEMFQEIPKIYSDGERVITHKSIPKFSFLNVLKDKETRKQIIIFTSIWFSTSLIYYGLSFNTANLSGDPYLNVLYLGISELPGPLTVLLFNNRFGRRKTLIGFLSTGAIILTFLAFIHDSYCRSMLSLVGIEDIETTVTVLSLFGRYCNAAGLAVVACFTAESFPTVARGTCMGLCGVAGNIGATLSPQLLLLGQLWNGAPFVGFSILSLFSSICCLKLNEMTGKPLDDTIPQKIQRSNSLALSIT